MKKVPGIAQVRVTLKDGLTVLDFEPDNAVTLGQLRQIIKNNGFVSKEAVVVARGNRSADEKTFLVAGTSEQLTLEGSPTKDGEYWRFTVRPPGKP